MEDKDPLAPELPLPPLKKPKLEKESDEESSDFAFVSFVDVKNELLEEEVTIKEEVVENPLQESSSSTACTQTDRDERLQFKIDLDRLKSKICPRKQVSGLKIKATENHVFQFKITLVRGGGPQIWRRIQVPGSHTFHDLHLAIQKSMGWKSVDFDYHLHSFEIVNPATGMDDTIVMADDVEIHRGELGEVKNEDVTKIIDYFTVAGHTARYEYDFGMSWIHQVLFEDAFVPNDGDEYPKCVGGQKACPPEDGVVSSDEEYDSDTFDPNGCF